MKRAAVLVSGTCWHDAQRTIFFEKSMFSVCMPSFFPGVLPRPAPIFFCLKADLSACKVTSLSPFTS